MDMREIAPSFMGMRVHSSPHAMMAKPVREHQEKPWMKGRAYHRRIQKKWDKRYGTRRVPAAFIFDPRAVGFGTGGLQMAVHPDAVAVMMLDGGKI